MTKHADSERFTKTPHDLLGRVPPAAFAVWTALGSHADRSTGECHPSMDRLARITKISRQVIGRMVVALERTGRLEVERKPNGVVTKYRLVFEGKERPPAVAERPPQVAERPPQVAERPPQVAERPPQVAPIKGVNQSQELESGTREAVAASGDDGSTGDTQKPKPEPSIPFDDWYQHYPRKVGRKDAERAWKKLTPAEKRKSLDVIPRYAAAKARLPPPERFIPNPSTWLNQGRWDDDPATWGSRKQNWNTKVSSKYERHYPKPKG